MTRTLTLENFSNNNPTLGGSAAATESGPVEITQLSEVDALEAYESGYKSGWEDCASAEAEERRVIAADLAKNLSEAKLTYASARRDVLAALGPFFEDVISTLLPRMATAAFLPCVLDELKEIAGGQMYSSVELRAAPATCPALERLAETEGIEGLVVLPEPAFAAGQVSLRLGSERRDIDMTAAADRIAAAIAGFQAHSSTTGSFEPNLAQGAV